MITLQRLNSVGVVEYNKKVSTFKDTQLLDEKFSSQTTEIEAFFQNIEPAKIQAKIQAINKLIGVEYHEVKNQDWSISWKKKFKPIKIGNILIQAPWHKNKRVLKQLKILLVNPGMAFGTGEHESTQLCIKSIQKIPGRSIKTLLDVGTGSGILAVTAEKCNYKKILAIDNDSLAVEKSYETVELNNCKKIRVTSQPLHTITSPFDVIVANILLNTLIEMRMDFLRLLKSNGHLILSGVLKTQERKLLSYYSKHFRTDSIHRKNEWISVVMKKLLVQI